jgi:hypothetical protein
VFSACGTAEAASDDASHAPLRTFLGMIRSLTGGVAAPRYSSLSQFNSS